MKSPRLLCCVALGQVLGILLVDAGLRCVDAPLSVLVSGALGVAGIVAIRTPLWVRASLAAAILTGGLHALELRAAERDRAHIDERARIFDACIEIAEPRSSGARYVWHRIRAADAGPALPERAEWYPRGAATPGARAGDCFRLRARFRELRGFANPGGRNRARQRARRGLAARITLVDERWIVPTRRALRTPGGWIEERRGQVAARLRERGPGGGLLAALSLGDRSGLRDGDRDAFAQLGIAHVLAVSGLHLALVAGFSFAGFRTLLGLAIPMRLAARQGLDVRGAALLAAALAATLYALMTGPGVAALRAWVVVVVAAAGFALGRPGSLRSGFWLAAAALLAWDPAALFDLGAQLSFAATGALLYAAPLPEDGEAGRLTDAEDPCVSAWLRRGLAALRSWFRDALRASSSAIAATAPLLALSGLGAGPFGLVANLVAVPWVGAVLLPASLLAAGVAACDPAAPSALVASGALSLASGLADATLAGAASSAAALPDVAPRQPTSLEAVLVASLVGGLSLRSCATHTRVALCLVAVAVLQVRVPLLDPGANRSASFTALDVGSGDALLLRSGRAAVLVDAGLAMPGGADGAPGYDAGEREVVPALAALGVRQLDAIVATHADADHSGGIPAVLRTLPVGEVWLPAGRGEDAGFAAVHAAARARGVPIREVGRGSPLAAFAPDFALEVIWPPGEPDPGIRGRNDASIVLRARIGRMRVLLAGDLGEAGERRLLASGADLSADVLKVGHHGSATSTSRAWLAAVAPQVAIVSARCGRSGLPSPRTLARLDAAGAATWWTGAHGAVRAEVRDAPAGAPRLHVAAERLSRGSGWDRRQAGCTPR